jgi:hypothetical protein
MLSGKQQHLFRPKENCVQPISKAELLHQFRNPPTEYGPIDCWWWEAGHLDQARMRWQLEDMKEKGVAGTRYLPEVCIRSTSPF